ncbi:MarR family transcriptional regulator [Acuticoccus sediminis]|uniref:HTH-type transcriptional regulator SarZ n=1 Tax=Acuticoccus sediminis TaxID=2184697 RepID=A0A8B2NV46_9HYPH|nr:MarR family transcriptional regulator [Acuticoccus sediminis]
MIKQAASPKNERPAVGGAPPSGLNAMVEAKLWGNPCWLTYRLNYLALRYNLPLYGWIEETYKLNRPEYVVIFSLGLKDGTCAAEIAASSGFPAGTMSRAVHKVQRLKLISRSRDPDDGRRFVLALTEKGRALFEETLPMFVEFEKRMLSALTEAEQNTLSQLMAKMVLASPDWPTSVPKAA